MFVNVRNFKKVVVLDPLEFCYTGILYRKRNTHDITSQFSDPPYWNVMSHREWHYPFTIDSRPNFRCAIHRCTQEATAMFNILGLIRQNDSFPTFHTPTGWPSF